jgi:cysteine-rich repeat protein
LEDCPGQQPRCNLARCEYEVPRCSGGSCTWEVVGKCDECSVCGDRWLDSVRGEECDDGDTDNTDKCTNTCKLASCGDAILQPRGADGANGGGDDEVCDDGNRSDNDGCSSVCTVETPPSCGNGIVEGEEECDQGVANSNTMPNRCRTNCRNFHCGDNVRDTGEECDDGNHLFRDGCSGSCRDEDASRACGNGILEDPEDCDDGKRCTNTGDPCFLASDCSGGICSAFNGDGCSTTCTREVLCGDGKRGGSEVCDDGGVCRGSSVVAYNGRLCTELDLQGNPLDGVQRCIATGGTCVPESSGGCQSNCLRRCRTRGEICFTDADCNEPDSAGCAVCVNGACEPY